MYRLSGGVYAVVVQRAWQTKDEEIKRDSDSDV